MGFETMIAGTDSELIAMNKEKWTMIRKTIGRPRLLIVCFHTIADALEAILAINGFSKNLSASYGIYYDRESKDSELMLVRLLILFEKQGDATKIEKTLREKFECNCHQFSGDIAGSFLMGATNELHQTINTMPLKVNIEFKGGKDYLGV